MRKLTILWLDDIRNPYKYLSKKSSSGTFVRNKQFYDGLMSKYDVDFIWVKNFDEFTNFILDNGLPQFVSFDHDLGAGLQKGAVCAKWLVEYCKKNGKKLPMFYVHSANPNGQREINGILKSFVSENKILREAQKIFPNRKSASMIAKAFRMHTGEKMEPEFVHWLAKKKGFRKYFYGKETYYASNLQTVVHTSYAKEYPIFLKEKEEKKRKEDERKERIRASYNPDEWIEPNRRPRFDENKVIEIIKEEIKETVRGVLKTNNPNYVDLKTAISNFKKNE